MLSLFYCFLSLGKNYRFCRQIAAWIADKKSMSKYESLWNQNAWNWTLFFHCTQTLRSFINYYIENNEASIITFHLGSIRDRFKSIDMLFEKFPSLTPEILGNNSIAAKSFLGLDPSTAPESLIIARVLDFNLFVIIPLFFIALYVFKNFNTEKKFLFSVVLILCFFSNLSNHPIAFLPIISTIFLKKNLIHKQWIKKL